VQTPVREVSLICCFNQIQNQTQIGRVILKQSIYLETNKNSQGMSEESASHPFEACQNACLKPISFMLAERINLLIEGIYIGEFFAPL
jgi:hypothetical protein